MIRLSLLSLAVCSICCHAGWTQTPDLGGTTPAKDFDWISTAKDMGKDGWWVENYIHNKNPGSVKVVWYTNVCNTWLGQSNKPVSLGVTKVGALAPVPANGFIQIDKNAKIPARYYYFPSVAIRPDKRPTVESEVNLTVHVGDKEVKLSFVTRSEIKDEKLSYSIVLKEKELASRFRIQWSALEGPKEAEPTMKFSKGTFENGYYSLADDGVAAFTTPGATSYSIRSGKLVIFDRERNELGAITSPALRRNTK